MTRDSNQGEDIVDDMHFDRDAAMKQQRTKEILTLLQSDEAREKVAKAIAVSIYHSEGLETMNYMGEDDYSRREWPHYTKQATAALNALVKMISSK